MGREHRVSRNDVTQEQVVENQTRSSARTAATPVSPNTSLITSPRATTPAVSSSTVTASEESVLVAAVQSSLF